MRLIVTRPEPDGERTARALIGLGHVAILSPMLDVVADARAALPAGPFQAILATSSNAVRALSENTGAAPLRSGLLLAVGDRTALLAKRSGFATVRSAGGDVDDLVALAGVELRPNAGPLLYAAGEAQAGDLAGRLRALGFQVETAIVYRTVPRPRLSGVAAEALRAGAADGVLLYSRASASAFALALRAAGLAPLSRHLACFCLSPATAEPLAAITQGPVLVAAKPDQLSLFALIESLAASASPTAHGGP